MSARHHRDMIGNATARRNFGKCGDPDPLTDLNRLAEKGELRVRPVVIAREQISPLTKATVRSDAHGGVVVDPNLFANPNMIAYLKEPGRFNIDAGFDYHPLPQFGSVEPQQRDLGPRRQQSQNPTPQDNCIQQIPRHPNKKPRISRNIRFLEGCEVKLGDGFFLHAAVPFRAVASLECTP